MNYVDKMRAFNTITKPESQNILNPTNDTKEKTSQRNTSEEVKKNVEDIHKIFREIRESIEQITKGTSEVIDTFSGIKQVYSEAGNQIHTPKKINTQEIKEGYKRDKEYAKNITEVLDNVKKLNLTVIENYLNSIRKLKFSPLQNAVKDACNNPISMKTNQR